MVVQFVPLLFVGGVGRDSVCVRLGKLGLFTFRKMLPLRGGMNTRCALGLQLGASFDQTSRASSLGCAVGCTRIFRTIGRRVGVPSRLLRRIVRHVTKQLFRSFPRVARVGVTLFGRGPPVKTRYRRAKIRYVCAGSWHSVGELMVFSLSKALLGAVTSLTTTAGCTLARFNCPARSASTCHFFIKGNVGGLFRETLPRSREAPRGILHVHSRFMPCCGLRGTSLDHPCPNVRRLLARLRRRRVRMTITSGGCRRTARGLVHRCFPSVRFATMFKRQRGMPAGPSPRIVRRVVKVDNMRGRRIICVNSSKMSVRAKLGTKIAAVNMY